MTFGDVVVLAVLALAVGLILRSMIRDRKKGRCCGCSGCTACNGQCAGCSGNRK